MVIPPPAEVKRHEQKKEGSKQVSDLLGALGVQPAAWDRQVLDSHTKAAELPNVVDILGRLPLPSSPSSVMLEHKADKSIAVCSTGHLRTFSLPGMYSSLEKHLLKTAPGSIDLFVVGHLGVYRGSDDAQDTVQMDGPSTADDEQLIQALDHLGLKGSDRVEHTSGDCSALEASWDRDGTEGRSCMGNGNFMQMMWLDHCVHMVRSSGRQYDLLVRMRPDVGIFQPFPWDSISTDHVTYMQKDAGGRVDWFFTVPWTTIDTWWDPIADMYARGFDGLPDYSIFSNPEMLVESNFPVVIVRGSRSAQCWRIVTSADLQSDCEHKTATGFWEQLVLAPAPSMV